jgi:hypothetical protein
MHGAFILKAFTLELKNVLNLFCGFAICHKNFVSAAHFHGNEGRADEFA